MTFNKKIRVAHESGYSLAFVLGKKEESNEEVHIQGRGAYKLERVKKNTGRNGKRDEGVRRNH
jgi:threonyl-tRNA synthetase